MLFGGMPLVCELAERSSVCTAPSLLGGAGLSDGLPGTTHGEDVGELAERGGIARVQSCVCWVETGSMETAGGLTSGSTWLSTWWSAPPT